MTRRDIYVLMIALLIGFLFAMCFVNITNYKETFDKDIQLVVARYNERLEWLNTGPFDKYDHIIYNKSDNSDFKSNNRTKKVVALKNVGRESHTYLHHVIENYDHLADITVFLHGSTNMENKHKKAVRLLEEIQKKDQSVFIGVKHKSVKEELHDFKIDEYASTNTHNAQMNPEKQLEPAKIRPYGKWYEDRFGEKSIEYVSYSGIFSVDKRDILQHPKSYYETLIKELENSSNPEVGHYFERSWAAVFYPMKHSLFLEE